MGAVQIILIFVVSIYSIVVITSFLSQAGKKGSTLYKIYLFGIVGLVLLGIPLANGVLQLQHIAIGIGAGVLLLAMYICLFGRSEVIGQRVSPSDAVFLMLNKRRRRAITFAKNEHWKEARSIFEELLAALPDRKKHKRMVCIHDITTCCVGLGDVAAIEKLISTARQKYSKNAAFILQLYHNLFLACKKSETGDYVQQLEQFANDNMKRLRKFKFTPEDGKSLKGTDAVNALVTWAKAEE